MYLRSMLLCVLGPSKSESIRSCNFYNFLSHYLDINKTIIENGFHLHISTLFYMFLSQIYDGTPEDGVLLATFCGSTLPGPLYSETNQITVTFTSDTSHHDLGFLMDWLAVTSSGVASSAVTGAQTSGTCDNLWQSSTDNLCQLYDKIALFQILFCFLLSFPLLLTISEPYVICFAGDAKIGETTIIV